MIQKYSMVIQNEHDVYIAIDQELAHAALEASLEPRWPSFGEALLITGSQWGTLGISLDHLGLLGACQHCAL